MPTKSARPRGRPRKRTADLQKKQVAVRVSATDWSQLERTAARRGMPTATLARQRVLRAVHRTSLANARLDENQPSSGITDAAWHWVELAMQAGEATSDSELAAQRTWALLSRAIKEL